MAILSLPVAITMWGSWIIKKVPSIFQAGWQVGKWLLPGQEDVQVTSEAQVQQDKAVAEQGKVCGWPEDHYHMTIGILG